MNSVKLLKTNNLVKDIEQQYDKTDSSLNKPVLNQKLNLNKQQTNQKLNHKGK